MVKGEKFVERSRIQTQSRPADKTLELHYLLPNEVFGLLMIRMQLKMISP